MSKPVPSVLKILLALREAVFVRINALVPSAQLFFADFRDCCGNILYIQGRLQRHDIIVSGINRLSTDDGQSKRISREAFVGPAQPRPMLPTSILSDHLAMVFAEVELVKLRRSVIALSIEAQALRGEKRLTSSHKRAMTIRFNLKCV